MLKVPSVRYQGLSIGHCSIGVPRKLSCPAHRDLPIYNPDICKVTSALGVGSRTYGLIRELRYTDYIA